MKNWRFGDFVWILEHLLASGLRGKVAPSAKKPRRAKKMRDQACGMVPRTTCTGKLMFIQK